MKKIFFALIIMSFIFAGCSSLPPRNAHTGWTKADFGKLPAEEKTFDFTFSGFQYHPSASRVIKYNAKIPLGYAPNAKHIDVEKLVQSIKDTYGITVNPAEFKESLNKKIAARRSGKWLNYFWRGTNKRNRLGVSILLYAAQEGIRLTPRLKMQIMLVKKYADGKMKVVAMDTNNVPLGDTSGFTKEDLYKAIRANSAIIRPEVVK